MKKIFCAFVIILAWRCAAFDQELFINFEKVGGNSIALEQLDCFIESNRNLSFREGLHIKKSRYVTIHDLTKNGDEFRFFIIDLETNKVEAYPSAHGSGNGDFKNKKIKAKYFSNRLGSDLTSSGFFITGDVYRNRKKAWRYGIRLHGLQVGENDHAFDRGVVIHAAKNRRGSYVSNSMISSDQDLIESFKTTMLSGMSDGCSAVAPEFWNSIEGRIKGGTLFFVFTQKYLNEGRSYCLKL